MTGGIIGAIYALIVVAGLVAAIHSVMSARTPQGTIAWGIALISMPLLSLPLYLIFGRSKFNGLVNARREDNELMTETAKRIEPGTSQFVVDLGEQHASARVPEKLTHLPFLKGNQTRLLIDGDATFDAILASIDKAREYVLAEFFIVKNDELGRLFQSSLIAAARRGCAVYLLFDEVGSKDIGRSYVRELREAGVRVSGVKSTKGWFNRFQLNFRNHRKIVVIDGYRAFVGGLNVGDEYVHRSKRLTPWRDTHMQIDGPAVLAVQIPFVEDWYWATREIPKLVWKPRPAPDADKTVLVVPSGPDDDYETCGMFFTHIINSAQKRLWIASPYFVPDEGIVNALQLAGLRGVDVRILIPGLADKWYVKDAAMSYVPQVAQAGIKMYEYGDGFLHQKVVLVDDAVSVIGTANFDNRSFRLNFEISIVIVDQLFHQEVEEMLIKDFAKSSLITDDQMARRSYVARIRSRVARLFAPIL